jgi:hypothetical protein
MGCSPSVVAIVSYMVFITTHAYMHSPCPTQLDNKGCGVKHTRLVACTQYTVVVFTSLLRDKS